MLPLVLLALLTLPAHADEQSLERLEASVNSAIVLSSDVNVFRKTVGLRSQLDPLFAATPLAQKGAQAARADIVNYLIDEQLIIQQFPVTDTEVEQEITSIQANLHLTRDGLKRLLAEQGYSFTQYYDLIRSGRATRDLIDRDIRSRVTIVDDDLRSAYSARFGGKEKTQMKYRIRIIRIDPSQYKTATAARDVALRAWSRLKGGESFEEVASAMSDDPSKEHGGDLGELSEREVNPKILSEIKKLRIGEYSSVLGDPRSGYFVLFLQDAMVGRDEQFEKVKENLRNDLAAGEYQRQRQLWLDRQRQQAFIKINI